MWAEKLGKQLGNPTRSLGGWLVSKLFKVRNQILEENAVQMLEIQPGDTVLELGHGPGLGLQAAAKLLTGPTGHLIGVDYSKYMHQVKYEYEDARNLIFKTYPVFNVYYEVLHKACL